MPWTHAHLVEQILLRNKVFLEHILVEVVGRADAPLHTAAGHLNKQDRGEVEEGKTAERILLTAFPNARALAARPLQIRTESSLFLCNSCSTNDHMVSFSATGENESTLYSWVPGALLKARGQACVSVHQAEIDNVALGFFHSSEPLAQPSLNTPAYSLPVDVCMRVYTSGAAARNCGGMPNYTRALEAIPHVETFLIKTRVNTTFGRRREYLYANTRPSTLLTGGSGFLLRTGSFLSLLSFLFFEFCSSRNIGSACGAYTSPTCQPRRKPMGGYIHANKKKHETP